MKYIQGVNRKQTAIFPVYIDESIDNECEVRLLDVFIESLDLESMGCKFNHIENSRQAYHLKDLLKLYIYSYMNNIR